MQNSHVPSSFINPKPIKLNNVGSLANKETRVSQFVINTGRSHKFLHQVHEKSGQTVETGIHIKKAQAPFK